MTTIIPYFDPILGKLRNSDVALISLATLVVTDPLVVNNLIVNSNASINTINAVRINSSQATLGYTHISTIDWNLTSGATALVEGQMNWDANQQTVVVGMPGGNVDLALGMEQLFPRRVRNSTGSLMPKGTVVYINGVSGNTPTVERAIATSDMSSAFTLGMTAEDIANTATGWVTTFGELTGIDLSAYTGGDTLYLSGATAGAFTNQIQLAPKHYVRVGTVVKATTDGALVVNVINGYELNELHNVVIASLASGQILQSGVSSLWYNRSLASAIAEAVTIPNLGSLGSFAVLNSLSYYALDSRLSLGSLAVLNSLSYYALDSRLSLGSLAVQNDVNFYNLVSYPSLGSLSILNSLSYYALDSRLSLGSLAVQNNLSYFSLDSRLSLGSLAVISTVDAPLVNLGTTIGVSLASISHNSLGNLTTGDVHTQYVFGAGRSGGQLITGGTANNNALTFRANTGTSNTLSATAFEWLAGNGGNNQRMVLQQDGALGVNTTVSTARLQLANGVTSVSGYNNAFQLSHSINKTTGDFIGAFFYVNDVAGGAGKTIYSHRAKVEYNAFPATTLAGMQATSNQMVISGGNRVNYAEVLTSNFEVFDTSIVDEARLIRLFAPNIASTASVSLLIGLDIPNITGAVTNWSIYSAGGNMYHKGNIGIGTTTASSKLEIDDSNPNLNRVTVEHSASSTAGYVGYQFQVDGAFAGGIYRKSDTNELTFWTQGLGSAPRMSIANNGRVGIGMGITAPAAITDIRQTSTTAALPPIYISQSDLSEEMIEFATTIGATNPIQVYTTSGTAPTHRIRVTLPGGLVRYLLVYA